MHSDVAPFADADADPSARPQGGLRMRAPRTRDGRRIWGLVRDSGVLDLNSPYAYLLVCRHFAETCIVADDGEALAGFVVGYRPPDAPQTMFVWQVGVSHDHRGRGLGRTLIVELLQRLDGVRFLEATVTPSNEASWRLFRSVAHHLGAAFESRPYFAEQDFPPGGHEREELVHIGPF